MTKSLEPRQNLRMQKYQVSQGQGYDELHHPIVRPTIQTNFLCTIICVPFTDTSPNSKKRNTETERREILVDTVSEKIQTLWLGAWL